MAEHPVCQFAYGPPAVDPYHTCPACQEAVAPTAQLPQTTSALAWLRRGALRDQHDAAALPVVESMLASLVADLEQQAHAAEGCEMVPPSHLLAEVAAWLRSLDAP